MIKEEHKKHGFRTWRGLRKWRVSTWIDRVRLRAKNRGMECEVTTKNISIPEVCPLLGIPLFFTDGEVTSNTPSMDRIDNKRGYTLDNIQVISWEANRLKSNQSLDGVRRMAAFYNKLVTVMESQLTR
jgi:hypothetical protein